VRVGEQVAREGRRRGQAAGAAAAAGCPNRRAAALVSRLHAISPLSSYL